MTKYFGYIGASIIWLAQKFNPSKEQKSLNQILFGSNFPENGFMKYQTFPVTLGAIFVLAIIFEIIFFKYLV